MRRVELVALDAATMAALAEGDLPRALLTAPVPLTAFFAESDQGRVWGIRAEQIVAQPADAPWVTRVVWDPMLGRAVGRAGFHGRPDERGMVEVGYETDPEFRRLGYARAALAELLAWATREPEVLWVRASVGPDNAASLALVRSFGFTAVSEQWDEQDGLEIVHEVSVVG